MVKSICRVSAVVPTYKRPALLACCLRALLEQDLAATAYEVIVADDAASDETRQLVEGWARLVCGSGKTLRYLPVADGAHGPAVARNAGWRAASGEIIAFTDDDCIPAPQWLRAGLEAFTADVVGVAGRLVVPIGPAPTDYEHNAACLANSEFVTANCFYRRACLESVGGFDERFATAWREDSDLFFSLYSSAPGRFLTAPEALVIHPVRPARWGISLGQQRKSMFNALLYKKHPEFYRSKVQAAPPWRYYAIVGALLAWIGAALAGRWPLAGGAACLWAFLTSSFCLRRLHRTSHRPAHVAEMLVTSILIPPLAIFWRLLGALKFRVWFL
jgi:glycosyltransferase involved in cell wall biosynthesis